MCEKIEDGGKRCAAHTRPGFDKVMDALRGASKFSRGAVKSGRTGQDTNMMLVIAHASTASGLKDVDKAIEEFEADRDVQTAMWLRTARKNGLAQGEAAAEVSKRLKAEKVKKERAKTAWSSPLRASAAVTPETSTAAVHPEIARMWHPEDNQGISADQTTPGQNAHVMLRCDNEHPPFRVRLNNVTRTLREHGRMPSCPECRGRRQKQLEDMQGVLRDFARAVEDDPEAWEHLTPAARHALMERAGMLDGGDFAAATAMSMVHGDLTLKEVLAAKNVEQVEGSVDETLGDAGGEIDADALGDLPMGNGVDELDSDGRIDRIMSSAGAAALAGDDDELAAMIVHENLEALWNEAHHAEAEGRVDEVLARVMDGADRNPYRARIAARFQAELDEVRTAPLPDGYSPQRLRSDGSADTISPTLMQRRFMLQVQAERRFMNLSGTGAGKTTAAVLATAGSAETLVIAPAGPVQQQWKNEYEQAFPGTEVRLGLPRPGEDLDAGRAGRRRVWVTTYDSFSKDIDGEDPRLTGLRSRVQSVVLDEIHYTKAVSGTEASLRNGNIGEFLDSAGESSPDLVVIGQSATPVVNDLSEAKSVLRMVHGPEAEDFDTAPTVANAAKVHRILSRSGVRLMPKYQVRLDKPVVDVDVSDRLPQVMGRLKQMQRDNGSSQVTPAMMERALLPEKMPAIMAAVRKLLPEKMPAIMAAVRKSPRTTVVYTEFTDGIADEIVAEARAQGFTAERYTGAEKPAERAEILRRAQRGEIRVLVGSSTISTGVDGLQRVSNNSVVVNPAPHAARDDQFVGRTLRKGQTEDVTVTYIKTSAKARTADGSGTLTWSWCERGLNRLKFKRSLADAAVDGIVPDGTLAGDGKAAEKTFAALNMLTEMISSDHEQAA